MIDYGSILAWLVAAVLLAFLIDDFHMPKAA